MKHPPSDLRKYCAVATALACALASCGGNPAKQKAEFLASGEKYAKAGKYQEAVIQYRNAIAIDPRWAAAHYRLALAYMELKVPQQAYQEFLSAVELDPANADAQLQLAALYIAGRKYDDAQKTLDRLVAADPSNFRAHTLLGEDYAARQAWEPAVHEFQIAMAGDASQIGNYAGLASVYLSTGRAAEAEAILRKATEAQPKSLDAVMALGRFYYPQHRIDDAERTMRAASSVDARAKAPRLLLAKIYIDSGKAPEAEQVCRELKELLPDDPEGYGALAWFYEMSSQKEKAAAELQAIAGAKPEDTSIKARLTDALIDLNRIQEASRINQELLVSHPHDSQGLSSRGRILIAEEKFAEAKTSLEQAVQSDPQSAIDHYLLAVAESSLGHSAAARPQFARALELSPAMADAAAALADLDAKAGDWDNALRLANQALQTKPDSALAHVVAAQAWIAKGNPAQAEPQLKFALERDPLYLPALAAMVDLAVSQGKTRDAVQRLSTLLAHHPGNARLHLLLGLACFKQGDFAKADVAVKQAVAIDRNTPDAYGLLGEISRAQGAWNQAAAWYKQAIETNPGKAENYMALSGIYEQQGDWEDAKRTAEHAHALDPASPYIANNLAYLYLEHGGDVYQALALAQQAKQQLANSPLVSDTIGWAYYKLGSKEAAVAQLSESVSRSPENSTFQYHLGLAYLAAGRAADAARCLKLALNDPHFPQSASARAALQSISKSAP